MVRQTIRSLAALTVALTTGTAAMADGYYFRARPAIIGSAAKPVPNLSLADATLPKAKVGQPWTFDFNALATRSNLGNGPVAWSGSGLPS